MSYQKDLNQTTAILKKISKDALQLAKKGQEQLIKLSDHGKFHLDASALSLKKERLFYLIGKEYLALKTPGKQSAKMKQLLHEFEKTDDYEKLLKKKLRPGK